MRGAGVLGRGVLKSLSCGLGIFKRHSDFWIGVNLFLFAYFFLFLHILTSFNAQTYVGDFKWLNVQNVDSASAYYNPDNSWGFYRSLMMSATKPVHPEFGIVIRHLRCPSDIGTATCSGTGGSESDLGSGDSFFV